ncbi:uncharacterized protein LOC130655123 isoform X2 [Hydractinia symbiolongicarpus]|uniref:uncharacterized protein LOC130655123 isoform X2 n=1 Tax=Hydractinia symbiolongicarpus TaxID=13093 RepID=UPI00254E5FCE|nr:uncharacterized protein LOC130655123 isoform X2 [Hydractinia symbiolongicarpus]
MDYAACVSNQFSKIGSVATPCSGDFSTCTEKYVIGFWFYVSHQETSIEQSKVFRFGDISMQVTYSSSEATIAAQTNIQWNGEICFFTTLPLNSWIYVNVELSSSNVSIFLNSVRIANSEGCSYPSGSKNDVMVLSIGSNVCIDDFSIFSVPNSYADAEVIYNWYLFGSTTDYRKYVQIKLIIFSQDFYQPANYNTEEKDFIYQSVHLMLKHFFSQYFTKPTIRYIGYKPVQLVKINPTRTTKVGLLVLLSYLPHNIENAFYTIPTQSFAHDGREYLIMRDYDKASTIGVLPTPLKFTATPLNSSTVTLKINNHVEDERYHVGFLVNITSYYLIDSLSIHHHFVKYFKTGRLKLFLFNLSPYKKYEIALWSLTHQGIGPRGKQVLHTPIDVNIIPPQDVGAFNTSHTSIEVEWSMYDNITHWNSENMTIRIYWKKVDFNYNNTQKSFSSYDYADMHSTLRNFSDFSYGDDVITSYEITGLEAFTNYSILVATVNDAGVGAFASMFCRSDQWLPEEAPNILLLELISPGVVFIRWNYTEDIEIFNSWEMSGYNLTIEPLYPSLSQSVAFTSLLLYKQDMFNSSVLDYFNLFKVTIFAFNEIGNGPTAQICFATGQEVPNYYLSIVKLINKTHNSINIRFGQVPRENENGIITHYVINYRPTDWKSTFINVIKNLTHTSDEWNYWKQMSNVNVSCSMKQPPNSSKVVDLNFTGLYPFTNYEFNFTPCTMVNCSNMQRTVVFRTAETYPSCAPNFTMSNTSSSSSLFITIGPLGHFCMNGILRFYHVVFLESELYGERIYNLLLNDILKENVENLTVNTHTATGLKKYWNYTAVVYVENSIGNGPHSFKWAVTAQDAPDGPPTNISGYANSSSSITLNVTLPKREHRNGIIRGYKVHLLNLINLTAHEVVFDVIDEPASILVVENLNFFTSYEIKVRAFTKVGDGPYTSDAPFLFSLILKTFEDVPTAPPSNVNVTSVTSDSVTVTWQKVPSDFQNGILNSFQLEISGILANNTLHTLRPPNISFLDYLDDYRSSISALFPYTQYNVSVQGCTTPGCGMKGWLQFTTDEMAPIGKIQFLQQINMDIKESLHFNWSDINPMKKRGEITFFISYNKHEKPWEEYNEFSTTFTVPGNQLSASIYNLNNYTSYRIAIYGIGRKGIGPLVTSDMRTSENVPLYSPQITFANNISSSGINVKFTKLPQSSWQGELLGYHVYYQHADEPTNCTAGQICKNMEFKDCIGDDINTCDVTELDLYTNYSVCIAGYTSAGVGPMSKCVYVITDTFVNGNWTEWSEWGNCDRSCANGTETKLRFCINPIPARGGANCSGLDVEQRLCNDFPCPGFYLAKPLTDCTETCENLGSKFACSDIIDTENTTHVFETSISGYDYTDIQGVTCSPDDSQKTFSKEYDPSFFFNKNICSGYARVPGRIKCSTDGKFSEGIRRLCYCVDIEAMSYTSWAIWSPCSVSCGRGVFRRFRTCLLESGCNKTVDIKDCNTQLCPVDGQWSAWTGFGKCSKSCGLGSNTRNRYCNSPPALFGGKKCEGKDSESIDGCNPNPCPRDGHWSEWSALRPCSRPCGAGGVQVKQRYCNNPEPLYGGDSCNGPDEIQYPCNEDVLCREIGVNFLIKMTNETWHYTIHYDNSVKGRKVRSHLINEVMAVMSNSSVGLSVVSDVVVNEMSRGSVIANFTVFYRVNSFVETLILQNAIDDIGFINTTPVQMLSITSHNVPYNAPKFTATSTVFDKIFVSWENDIDWAIPEQFSMYYVFYRNLTVPNVNWTSLGTVNTTIEITDLKGDTLYGIRLIAGISDANGIASMELKVRTAEGAPGVPPPDVSWEDRFSSYRIKITWNPIPAEEENGYVVGYKMEYVLVRQADIDVTVGETLSVKEVDRFTFSAYIDDLSPYSMYKFKIFAFAKEGDGPAFTFTAETCRCPEYIYSNFHSLQPYIYHDRSKGKDIQGFFPQLLTTILKEVCTNCKTYTVPKIYFDRTLTGHSAEKQNAQHMKEDIGSTVQLNMPVYGKFAVRKYAGIYPYIGIVRTQGSAAIMYNQKVRRYQMKDLLRNVFASWTIVAIMVLLSIKFGLLLWFTEQCSSTSNFTLSDCRKGALQGMWMAFVTIGTVGYGDYVPTTRLSKVLTICWTLIGLITTSIFIASISTNLVSSNLQQEVKLYGVEVAVIPGTAEYSLAVARNAKIYNVSRPMHVLEAVNKDIVSIGLLDALTATSYSDYLKKMTLTVKKIFDTSSGYGTVLSGGLESLEDDVRSYVDANQGSISAFINSQTDVLKPNVTILKTELIAKAELVDFSIMLCYVFLAFCAFGISVWLCCLKRNRAKKIQPIVSRDVMVKKELTQDINDFAHNFKSRVKKMDEKHFGELSRLQVLRTNFMRLMKRHGHTEKEVNDRFEAIRRKHLKKISKRNRLKYLETNI